MVVVVGGSWLQAAVVVYLIVYGVVYRQRQAPPLIQVPAKLDPKLGSCVYTWHQDFHPHSP